MNGQVTIALLALGLLCSRTSSALEVQVAVAANFAGPMRVIARDFAKETGHDAVIVTGATGKLYAQIRNGAPFELLLAADETTPRKLDDEGLTLPTTRFTYALGRLALFSAKPGYVDPGGAVLNGSKFAHLAIANPKLAPYGAAAIAVLTKLGLLGALRSKLVEGENIAQTFEFVNTGNAELGFVALSQVMMPGRPQQGSVWLVPETLYAPIRQDAVVLKKGASNPAATALVEFLKTSPVRKLIRAHGYGLEPLPVEAPSNLSVGRRPLAQCSRPLPLE